MLYQDKLEFLRFDVDEFLKQYDNKKVLYFPNTGNAGDSFIAVGTYQAFRRRGVVVEIIDLDYDVTGQVVFLGGGGNFVPLYTDIKAAFQKFLGRASKCILLPHTIRGNEDVISRLDDTCTVFCRDLTSFKHVLAVNSSLDVRLSHDMAFHADVQALLNDEAIRKAAQRILTEKLNSIGLTEAMIERWPNVEMLRLDSESRASAPQSDVDVSDLFMLGVRPNEAEIAAWCFLTTIKLAKNITTDRLHVGIAAAMLGIPCTLRDNSYGKNLSVFDHSLKYFSINNDGSKFRFKPGMPSAATDKPQSVALSRQLDQKIEIFNSERQTLTSALESARQQSANTAAEREKLVSELEQARKDLVERGERLAAAQQQSANTAAEREKLVSELEQARKDLVERGERLAAAQQQSANTAAEREKLVSELEQARKDLVERGERLAAAQQQSAIAAAELAGFHANLDQHSQTMSYKASHIPREIGRYIRSPFTRLAFHKSGKPRGWVRKSLFHSNGRVRGVFRLWVYNANGESRRPFEIWLSASTNKSPPASLSAASVLAAPASAGAILVAADFPPLYDQSAGGLRLKTLIGMIGNLQRPIIFASSYERTFLPGVLGADEGRIHYENVLKKAGVSEFTYGLEELNVLLEDQSLDLSFAFLSFPDVAESFLPIIRHYRPAAKIIFDMVDFHALRMEREAELKGDAKLADNAAAMKTREISLAKTADVTIAISADEKKTLLELAPTAVIEILPTIFEIPTKAPLGTEGRKDVLFLGGFWHTPNGDAAKWFVEHIWPRVSAAAPGNRFLIAGSNPGDDVLALGRIEGVEVLGYVADLEPLYDAARVCVAPLRFGAGVKGKVGQSMAFGLPLVATSVGAEGMRLRHGEHLLIADDPEAFAQHVIALLHDDALWGRMQAQARTHIAAQFSVAALSEKVEALFHA